MKPLLFYCLLLLLPGVSLASPLPGTPERAPEVQEQDEAEQQETQSTTWQQFNFWIMQKQREFHRSLADAMEKLSEQVTWNNAWALLLLSFLYGVFHAAGPGHGKAVLTAYLVTQPEKLRRGLFLSFIAALLQGVTAILLVTLLVHLLGRLAREAFASVVYVEMASFAAIALLGLGLLVTALHRLWKLRYTPAPILQYPIAKQKLQQDFVSLKPLETASPGKSPQVCPSCGKAHHLAPEQTEGKSLLQTSGLLLSIGLRPCSGAVLVLVVANLLGLWWMGVAAVMTMAIGTSLTVMFLATLAVKTRDLAYRLLGLQGHALTWLALLLGGLGGLAILLLGISLLMSVNQAPHPLGIT
ncbi:nickel/cobalt transporter [Marinospirillum sp.]|uniref:nickel/cobalt transporter n=1 Tax=Marinospirillum sp. TaxID=2183934 RepID=UPI00384ECDE5